MKTKIFGGIAVLAIALATAFNVSLNLNKSNNQLSLLALANVEALAGGETSICPDHNYVPDRFIEAEPSTGSYTCTVGGELTVGSNRLIGNYTTGSSYPISIETKNCSGKKGACCDQRMVGVKVVS